MKRWISAAALLAFAAGAIACASSGGDHACLSEDESVSSTCPPSKSDFPGTKQAGDACSTAQECAGVCCPCGGSAAACICGKCADQASACNCKQ